MRDIVEGRKEAKLDISNTIANVTWTGKKKRNKDARQIETTKPAMQWQRHDQSITSKVHLDYTFAVLGIDLASLYIIVSSIVSFTSRT